MRNLNRAEVFPARMPKVVPHLSKGCTVNSQITQKQRSSSFFDFNHMRDGGPESTLMDRETKRIYFPDRPH